MVYGFERFNNGENQTISNWFVDYLTFKAYALHKDLELDLYLRGKA